jgi:hypothetical protein
MTTPPTSRRGDAPRARTRRGRPLWTVGAVVLVVAGLVVAYALFLSDRARRHELPVRWPVSIPRGDPVPVAHGVAAGDVFVTTVESSARFVLSTEDAVATRSGMRLNVAFTLGHAVAERPGGGLRSTVKAFLDRADTDVPDVREGLTLFFGDRSRPYTVAFDRDERGRPVPATASGDLRRAGARLLFDRALGGLGDLVTNWLPPRDVRLGEAWDLAGVADLSGAQETVHFLARSGAGEGYPAPVVRGAASAEATEERDGEPTLRLRVVWSLSQEGEAAAPAKAGRLTTAAVIEGTVWVSRATGLVVEALFESRILSSYLVPNYPTERKGEGRVTWRTRRAERMPE